MEIFRWCSTCQADEAFDRPEGPDAPEAFCVECGEAVFLWADLPQLADAGLAAAA